MVTRSLSIATTTTRRSLSTSTPGTSAIQTSLSAGLLVLIFRHRGKSGCPLASSFAQGRLVTLLGGGMPGEQIHEIDPVLGRNQVEWDLDSRKSIEEAQVVLKPIYHSLDQIRYDSGIRLGVIGRAKCEHG